MNTNRKERLGRILPLYSVLPILVSLILNQVVYYGARLLMQNGRHYDMSIAAIDGNIPFLRWTIVFYVLAYVFWGVGYWYIARESRAVCCEVFAADVVAKLGCLVFFLLLPTEMVDWPSGQFALENGFDRLTQLIYDVDQPDNLFPSIHCLESWMIFRGVTKCKRSGKALRAGALLFALAICASTLLVKQHVFLDVVGGVALAELGLLLSHQFRLGRIYTLLDRRTAESIPEKD